MDTMSYTLHRPSSGHTRAAVHRTQRSDGVGKRERRTIGGALAYLLVVPFALVVLAAPQLVLAVALGGLTATAVGVGLTVYRAIRRGTDRTNRVAHPTADQLS